MNAIPFAVWVAIFSLVVQSSGVRPGPRLPVVNITIKSSRFYFNKVEDFFRRCY